MQQVAIKILQNLGIHQHTLTNSSRLRYLLCTIHDYDKMIRCERNVAQHRRAKASVAHKELKCAGKGSGVRRKGGGGDVCGSLAATTQHYVATSERRGCTTRGRQMGSSPGVPLTHKEHLTLMCTRPVFHLYLRDSVSPHYTTGRADVANHSARFT